MKTTARLLSGAAFTALSLGAALAADAPAEVDTSTVARRLTADEYRTIITDVFGPTIELGGRFEPELRVKGLLAVGTTHVSVTSAGMEQYDVMARAIANQVVDAKHRDLIPCRPANDKAADDACTGTFMAKVGRLLYRRPLTDAELKTYVGAARVATAETKDYWNGLSMSLAAMLSSPKFLFRQVAIVPEPGKPGQWRMEAHAKAQQLSFFLWNAGPDLELLAAAERGDLDTKKGLAKQVDRMMASSRVEAGVRAFFIDNLGFDEFDTLTKDAALFPKFSAQAAADAQEQTLKTIVDLLLTHKGDYRDVFTTKKTFLTQELASIYKVPLVNDGPNGAPDTWVPFEFSKDDPRGGILTQVAFTALHSPPGRGSPTLRGKALREVLLCQKVPAPPAAVKFDIVQDTNNPLYKTARERLKAHATNPVCAGCHKIIDPMGLALENFDGAGAYRLTENGVPIDTSGSLDGVNFTNSAELGKAIHDNPASSSCLVSRLSSYATGRPIDTGMPWAQALLKNFSAGGYKLPDLMRDIALSDDFFSVTPPDTKAAEAAAPNQPAR
ncbi:MAG: DUF1592 domain-containing protein [Rhodospirillaceae bacterium]|nr:DUF1592 domain-containing protein [Rhodospirillaceae bacterium]